VRHGDQADATVILTALGVDMAGNKEVLAALACAEEGKEGWVSVLEDLRARGATQMDLLVTDGHEGLLAAVQALFPATPRQRCLLHKQQNVLNAVPRRVRHDVETELLGIWAQPNKEGALIQLLPSKPNTASCIQRQSGAWQRKRSTPSSFTSFCRRCTGIFARPMRTLSLFSNVRQRTDQIDVFTTEMSCLTIVWATIEGIALRKIPV
jgi:putative transposase